MKTSGNSLCMIKRRRRAKTGRNIFAAAAYRAGEKITNEFDGETHDYTRKGGVVHTEIREARTLKERRYTP